ncbi:MAG: hypothetical protein K2M17_04355 [Bacilli bacterium]|nr:hypothetical protein [Bacilli bacterium]
MTRVNGHIDLCEILGIPNERYLDTSEGWEKLHHLLLENDAVQVIRYELKSDLNFSFVWNGEKYFFKYDRFVDSYNELVMEELLHDLNIPSVHFDLACLGNILGVISKNYEHEDAVYIDGRTLMIESRMYDKKADIFLSSGDEEEYDSIEVKHKKYSTLEDIWAALEIRYQNRVDGIQIVANLMQKIVDMFLFSILTSQTDQNLSNWKIIEYKDGRVDFQVLFDNERFMMIPPDFVRLSLSVLHTGSYFGSSTLLKNNLQCFQNVSSSEYTSLLAEMLWVLESENVEKIIARIEKRTEHPMPEKFKQNLLNNFGCQLEFLKKALAIEGNSVKR